MGPTGDRSKYQLPNVFPLEGYRFDVKRLQAETSSLLGGFTDVRKENSRYFSNIGPLAERAGENFLQLNLTVFNTKRFPCAPAPPPLPPLSKTQSYVKRLAPDDPMAKEHNYDMPTTLYLDSYFKEVADSFKAPAIRVRLTRLISRTVLDPHIDYDPTYATRVLIPIFTNEESFTVVWRRNQPCFYRFNELGQAYFLNTGLKHGVVNMGASDRIMLVISLASQADIQCIPDEKSSWRLFDPQLTEHVY